MNRKIKKVIAVKNKTAEKISGKMFLLLAAIGVEIRIKETAPTIVEVAEELNFDLMDKTVKVVDLLEEDKMRQAKASRLVKKYAPKKIGDVSMAKFKQIRGKRYGR